MAIWNHIGLNKDTLEQAAKGMMLEIWTTNSYIWQTMPFKKNQTHMANTKQEIKFLIPVSKGI